MIIIFRFVAPVLFALLKLKNAAKPVDVVPSYTNFVLSMPNSAKWPILWIKWTGTLRIKSLLFFPFKMKALLSFTKFASNDNQVYLLSSTMIPNAQLKLLWQYWTFLIGIIKFIHETFRTSPCSSESRFIFRKTFQI